MKEIYISHHITWEDVKAIVKKSREYNELIIVKIPKSLINHPYLKYKIEYLKEHFIFIEPTNRKPGRPSLDKNTIEKIKELRKHGKSIRKIAKELNISPPTVLKYLQQIEDDKFKLERFWELMWKFKEVAVMEEWYDGYAKALFAELEAYIKSENLDKAKEVLDKIIEYRNNMTEE